MNFVLIVLLTILLAFGRPAAQPKPAGPATITTAGTTTAPVVAPLAEATDVPTPTPYDGIPGSGPSH